MVFPRWRDLNPGNATTCSPLPPASQVSQARSCSPLTSLPSLQVIDHSGARLGEYEDVSKVEKYQISQEAYDQRQGTATEGWMGASGGHKGSVWVDRGRGKTGTLWGGRWCGQWGQTNMASRGRGMQLVCGQIGLGGVQGVGVNGCWEV